MGEREPESDPPPVGVREGYNRWAKKYDSDHNPLIGLETTLVPGLWGEVSGRRILDLGCGTGRHTNRLLEEGARVVGLELSQRMLQIALEKTKGGEARFLRADLRKSIPLRGGVFEGLVCNLVLEHLEDLPGFFSEVKRVCAPGGFVVVSEMHPAMRLKGTQAGFRSNSGEKIQVKSVPHTLSDIIGAVLENGLEIVHLGEHAGTRKLAEDYPRAEKYVDWPMLFTMKLRVP